VSLGIKQMTEDPWLHAIPEKYIPGHIIKGKVAKLTNFGAFVELEPDLEGLLHISELADHKISKPTDVVNVGDEVEVKILKVDSEARKIGLSLRRVKWAAEGQENEPVQQGASEGPQTNISSADVDEAVKTQDKDEKAEKAEAKLSKQGEQEGEVAEAEKAEKADIGEVEMEKESEEGQVERPQEDTDTESRDNTDSNVKENKT